MGKVKTKKRTAVLKQLLAYNGSKTSVHLFDDIERKDSSPKQRNEKYYHFYNRSSRPQIAKVRSFIELCLSNYPKGERDDVCARFRSGNDDQFKSISFELFLHEALQRQGCELTPHPTLKNGSKKKPDFLVNTDSDEKFYLEATLASDTSEVERGAIARKSRALDTLNRSPHENFLILVSESGSPLGQPNGKRLAADVHRWLDSLDADKMFKSKALNDPETEPQYQWQSEGWRLQIRAWPLEPKLRGRSKALIGGGTVSVGAGDLPKSIRDKVQQKARRYGELDAPLVIAVNVDSSNIDHIDEEQALFGKEQFVFRPAENPQLIRRRIPNGAWYGYKGPQGKRGSAVWLFNNLHASSLATTISTVYFNPWATHVAPDFFKRFNHAVLGENKITRTPGLSLSTIFGLHSYWPGEEPK